MGRWDGERQEKNILFFICGKEKVSYLCSPKRNGSYQTEFGSDKKKDWNNDVQNWGGTLRPPKHGTGLQHIQAAVMRAGKFIKEISFLKSAAGRRCYCRVHTASCFLWVGSYRQHNKNRQSILVNRCVSVRIHILQWRVWSWLRMNASGRPNTCKSRGMGSLLPRDRRTGA